MRDCLVTMLKAEEQGDTFIISKLKKMVNADLQTLVILCQVDRLDIIARVDGRVSSSDFRLQTGLSKEKQECGYKSK